MNITKVSATNLKGRSFDHELSSLTAITGRNFAGKTAIVTAIRLAILGHIPELGKTNRATWELSSGLQMSAKVDFDSGAFIKRTFRMERDSVKEELEASNGKGQGYEKQDAEDADFPLLNAEAYFNLTDSERIDYVFARAVLPDEYKATKIIADLEQITFGSAHSESIEKAKAAIVAKVRQTLDNIDIATGLDELTKDKGVLKTEFSYWNKRTKDTQGAARVLTEFKLREKECSADTFSEIDTALEAHRKSLGEFNVKKGEFAAQLAEAKRTAIRRNQLTEIVHSAGVDNSAAIEGYEKKIKAQLPASKKTDPAEKLEAARAKQSELNTQSRLLTANIDGHQKAIVEAIEELDDLSHKKACPFCKSKGKGWQAEVQKGYEEKKAAAENLKAESEAKLKDLTGQLETLMKSIEKMTALQNEITNAKADIDQMGIRISDLKNNQESQDKSRAQSKAELENLLVAKVPSDDQQAELNSSLAQVHIAIESLEARRTAATQLEQDMKRAAEAGLEHEEAAAYVAVIKEVGAKLKELKEQMVANVFDGLLKTANAICGQILASPLAFHEGDIGRWNGSKFITHRAFSGTEKALAYICIATALSTQSPFKLVILDEFGRLDPDNQVRVAAALGKAQADGVIDQAVIIGTMMLPFPDWSYIKL